MVKVVIISGKQGSGKTTLANLICREYKTLGYDQVRVLTFAEELKKIQDYILNTMERLTGVKRPSKDGDLLQMIGTDWAWPKYGDDVWIKIVKRKIEYIKNHCSSKTLIIIEDCRTESEFDAFPDSLSIRLFANEDDRRKRAEYWRHNINHISETGLDTYSASGKFDYYFDTSDKHINITPKYILNALIENSKLHHVPEEFSHG